MKIAISADSAIDFSTELINKYQIKVIPFTVCLGDRVGFDGQITTDDIIDYVNKTNKLPKTSSINEEEYKQHFSSLLKDYDAIIHFNISSKLSSAYNNACLASKGLRNVFVIDTLSLSCGIGLLTIYAKNLIENGYKINDVIKMVQNRIAHVQVSCELKRIDYLYKGGRCGALTLLGANVLKIRPKIKVENGLLVPCKKYMGNFENIVKKYVNDLLDDYNTPDLDTAFIVYTTASESIIENTRQLLVSRGFKNVYVTRAGATVSTYTGEDCVGVYYINDGLNS